MQVREDVVLTLAVTVVFLQVVSPMARLGKTKTWLLEPFTRWQIRFGFFHPWQFFNMGNHMNVDVTAKVTTEDGSTRVIEDVWRLGVGWVSPVLSERYRKAILFQIRYPSQVDQQNYLAAIKRKIRTHYPDVRDVSISIRQDYYGQRTIDGKMVSKLAKQFLTVLKPSTTLIKPVTTFPRPPGTTAPAAAAAPASRPAAALPARPAPAVASGAGGARPTASALPRRPTRAQVWSWITAALGPDSDQVRAIRVEPPPGGGDGWLVTMRVGTTDAAPRPSPNPTAKPGAAPAPARGTATPTSKPGAAAPTSKPGAAAPTSKPGAAAPTSKPGAVAPTSKPGAVAPTSKPGAAPPASPAASSPTKTS